MTGRVQVAVGTIARFHSFDLAYQLQRHGSLAAIYTAYPRRVFRGTGVESQRIRTFPWLQTPTAVMRGRRLIPRFAQRNLDWWAHQTFDRYLARHLVDCHVLSVLSGSGLAAGKAAQARGIAYVCDRGSSHIVYQDRILREEYGLLGLPFAGVDPRIMAKEQREYEQADAITVPSGFVHRSFVEEGVAEAKLHRIPYGVNLDTFRPLAELDGAERGKEFRVLFVGQLSVRKGLHYLLQAFSRAALPKARLVLVGSPQPETDELLRRYPVAALERTGTLPQPEVARQMSRASVLVLPSVEEGLAMVQAQALACGCPVIATVNTGSEDLFEDGEQGFIVSIRDADAIAERLTTLHDDRQLQAQMSVAALARGHKLGGGETYGRASINLFRELAVAKGHDVAPLGSAQ